MAGFQETYNGQQNRMLLDYELNRKKIEPMMNLIVHYSEKYNNQEIMNASKVKQLTDMGFELQMVEKYLPLADYNLMTAIEFLMQTTNADINDNNPEKKEIEIQFKVHSGRNIGNITKAEGNILLKDPDSEEAICILYNNYLLILAIRGSLTRESVDLTAIEKYLIDENIEGLDIELYEIHGRIKNFSFHGREFIKKITELLTANCATLFKENEMNYIQNKNIINENSFLFASHLFTAHVDDGNIMHQNTPYYCVLRNGKIEMYEDFGSKEPLKCLDILSLFSNVRPIMHEGFYGLALVKKENISNVGTLSNCPKKHGLQEIGTAFETYTCCECRTKYNITMYVCEICKYGVCVNCAMMYGETFLFSLSNNDRYEWLSHLQFLLKFKIMPNEIDIKLEKKEIKSILKAMNKEITETTDVNVNTVETKEEKNMIADIILDSLELRKEEVLDAIGNNSSSTVGEKLLLIDKISQKWNSNERKINSHSISLNIIWKELGIRNSFVQRCYSRVIMDELIHKKRQLCSLRHSCVSFKNYNRDRYRNRDIDNKTMDDNINIMCASVEDNVIDIADKIHALLYSHTMYDEHENEEKKENEDILNTNSTNKKVEQRQMNTNKFVIAGKGKFGFGESCAYCYADREYSNFIVPASPCLFIEVCSNPMIPSKFCLKPINFWCLYLQAIKLRNAFLLDFTGRQGGMELGSLMSINHYSCLLLYSDWTVFQNEFKKYTRRINEQETLSEFYVRNSFVAHWNRYLQQCVMVYGSDFSASDVVYCGISVPLVFDSFDQRMYAPLSTTVSKRIGEQFAGTDGILLKLQRVNENTRYFPLLKFSQYPEEEEWFVCYTQLKIINIGFQSSFSKVMISSKKYIRAMSLLEKIVRGNMFVDIDENNLVAESNIQLLFDFLNASVNGCIINGKSANKSKNEFYQYMQDLFNHRLYKFSMLELNRNKDPHGFNQTWINESELDRISCLPLKETIMSFLKNHSLNKINYVPKPILFEMKEEIVQEYRVMKVNQDIIIRNFTIEKNGQIFQWRLELYKPDYSPSFKFYLKLDHWPQPCGEQMCVSYDVICPETKFENLNRWQLFNNGGKQTFEIPINSNLSYFTIILCIRILFC